MSVRRFVIGDVHGCSRTLRRLTALGIGLTRDDELYLLGDLIDRGPDSKGVLDFIFELREDNYRVMAVRGNHEDMCLRAGEDPELYEIWLANGGQTTLAGFRADGPGDIPHPYRAFLGSLPHYLLLDDFVIVHAGLNFDRSDPFSDTQAMLWRRDCTVDLQRTGGRRLVSGHTALSRDQVEASVTTNRILLDNGCVFAAGRPGMGSLAALELNTMTLTFQKNIDR